MTDPAHPDVVPYAQEDPLTNEQRARIVEHLKGCEECRDLVIFVRKTNATLRYEGRVSRVAKALQMSAEAIEREVQAGTSLAVLLKGPPAAPVTESPSPVRPISPVKK
jgi:hypothetical protein